ncbi:TetR/AcrR family transcriptional regulator [Leucobacter allii]|uniref:TetR/AcrR family transcriptional regulator n=1 Tax=Leucobacter allii TaxID=2932247 RepID=UPI001FD3047A|nr:helix-turn-helix domain-containing protein [Leucobacter allii]UOR00768.1 TetR/AcrR family transcriptional regulator [Leucobacter allii]
MSSTDALTAPSRQARRKAATRAGILRAAEALFAERGYAETAIEDIAEAADVAVRTIYAHFPSKAAILLDHFDDWLDAFVAAFSARPLDEPICAAVRAASRAADGRCPGGDSWQAMGGALPIVEDLVAGSPDIAGHVLQRWMRAQERIAADAAARGSWPAGSVEPRARAVAAFTAWIASVSEIRSGSPDVDPGIDVLARVTSGEL